MDLDQVPGPALFLRGRTAVEKDGQAAVPQVSDAVAVGVAVEEELDLGEPLEEGFEGFSAKKALALRLIRENRKVVEENDSVACGNLLQRPFELLLELGGEVAVGGEQRGGNRRVEREEPPALAQMSAGHLIVSKAERGQRIGRRAEGGREIVVKQLFAIGFFRVLVVVAGQGEHLEFFMLEAIDELLGQGEFRFMGCRGEVACDQDSIDLVFLKDGKESGQVFRPDRLFAVEQVVEIAQPSLRTKLKRVPSRLGEVKI